MKIIKSSKNAQGKKVIYSSSNKKRNQAVMAGAGSGITIEFDSINFDAVIDSILEGTTLQGSATGTIDIERIGTYYDGGTVNESLACNIDFVLETDDVEALNDDIEEFGVEDIISCLDYDKKALIVGGWTRSTFDGTFSFECWDMSLGGTLTVTLTDSEYVQYLDRVAHGEDIFTEYEVYINDNPQGTIYEDLDEAIKSAEQYIDDETGVYVVRSDYREFYNGDADLVYDEVVWTNLYDEEDYYDEDFE
ncbi:MAG: hypothetical protein NC227_10930 [Bacteroides sp.]|nr:hypothetical protein [Bacteroides sp.]MCM1361779.1 hypothetical protein [Clostridiales bacterium]